MLRLEDIHTPNPMSRPHVFVAFVACLLSLVFHAILMLLLLRMPLAFHFLREPRADEPPPPKPLQVAEVRPGPPVSLHRPRALVPEEMSGGTGVERGTEIVGTRPDESLLEPPALPVSRIPGEQGRIAEHGPTYERRPWEPRQEIYAIEKKIVRDELLNPRESLPRRRIPKIERIAGAPDVVAAIDRDRIGPSSGLSELVTGTTQPGKAPLSRRAAGGPGGGGSTVAPLVIGEKEVVPISRLFGEGAAQVSPLKPIEQLLSVRLFTYT
ncbi:MAG: hypothetical protein N2255_00440, partial [Kiritimatiellae bacterium]|nr:hypothetical protein [Kiritimatiellia bacterium]